MIGEIAVVRLIINGSVTLHLYSTFYKNKIYQPTFLYRDAPEVMETPCRSVSDFRRNASILHSTFRQYSDRLGIYRSIKVSGNNYRKVTRHLFYLLKYQHGTFATCHFTYMIEMSIESSYFPTTHLFFQYRPSHNTLASRIPAFLSDGIRSFTQPKISTLQ